MKFKTLMFVAAFGLAGSAFAGGDKDKNKDADTSAQFEESTEEAQKHAEKAEKQAEKAGQAAERAQQQGDRQAQQGQAAGSAEEQAAQREMEAMMAEEIERRVEAAEDAPEKRVFGKVIGVNQERLILDIGGAALPVTVNRDTKIEGEAIPRAKRIQAHLRSEFQPGQLISVTYDLKNMENVALNVEELQQQQGQQQQGQQQQGQQQQGQQQQGQQQQQRPMQEPMGEEPMGERPMRDEAMDDHDMGSMDSEL